MLYMQVCDLKKTQHKTQPKNPNLFHKVVILTVTEADDIVLHKPIRKVIYFEVNILPLT